MSALDTFESSNTHRTTGTWRKEIALRSMAITERFRCVRESGYYKRKLSLRITRFSQGQLLWQCRATKGSSKLSWHEMVSKHDDSQHLPLKLNKKEDLSPSGPDFQRDHRYELAKNYSS